jgi:hypothetical protein
VGAVVVILISAGDTTRGCAVKHFHINSAADAQHVLREHPTRDPRNVDSLGHKRHTPAAHHFGGDGELDTANGTAFAVDPTEFSVALEQIRAVCDSLVKHASTAAGLATDLPDGSGPVADIIGRAFDHRLGASGGMHYVTDTISRHGREILTGLTETITNYQQAEQAAVDAVAQSGGDVTA